MGEVISRDKIAAASPAFTLRSMPTTVQVAIAGILCVALALRLSIATGNLTALDRLFVPDDAYYTLTVARSLANGLGPRVGEHMTNGFQPLLAFLEVPVFWTTRSNDHGIRYALVLLALCDSFTTVFLCRISYRMGGTPAALVTGGLWAVSPVAIGNALCGLETALAIMLEIALVDAWISARQQQSGMARWSLVGAIGALAVLARIEAIFLVVTLFLTDGIRITFRHTGVAVAAGVVVISPWWGYSWWKFGTVVPASGNAMINLAALQRPSLGRALSYSASTVLGGPMGLPKSVLKSIADSSVGPYLFIAIILVYLAAAGIIFTRDYSLRGASAIPIFGVALLLFYSTVLVAMWFGTRYEAPTVAVTTLLLGLILGWSWRQVPQRPLRMIGVMAVSCGITIAGCQILRWPMPAQGHHVDYDGDKGFREATEEILAEVPAGAAVGSMQTGALQYFAPPGVRVINLDGVVNPDAAQALEQRRLGIYARSQGVLYFADWQMNQLNFVAVAGLRELKLDSFQPTAWAAPQGNRQFVLWKISWPPR